MESLWWRIVISPGGRGHPTRNHHAPAELPELSIDAVQEGFRAGTFTARSLTQSYLERIDAMDQRGPTLRCVLETNPDALTIADALDRERQSRGPAGLPHAYRFW